MNRRASCGPEYLCIDDARKPDGVWHESSCPRNGRLDSYVRHVRSMTSNEIRDLAKIRGPHAGTGCVCNQCRQAEALAFVVRNGALDGGDEADGLRAQLIEMEAKYGLLVCKANQLVRYWSAKGAQQELRDALDALNRLDDDL